MPAVSPAVLCATVVFQILAYKHFASSFLDGDSRQPERGTWTRTLIVTLVGTVGTAVVGFGAGLAGLSLAPTIGLGCLVQLMVVTVGFNTNPAMAFALMIMGAIANTLVSLTAIAHPVLPALVACVWLLRIVSQGSKRPAHWAR